MKVFSGGRLMLTMAALTLIYCSGCATPEDNAVRPWNAPKSWESGVPQGMMQGR